MALTIGDTAPDFEAETSEGPISFHEWLGDSWGVLFSHPRDFTPVCTTELGYMASIKPEFDKRNTKIIGLSVDPVGNHEKWSADIQTATGTAPNYPLIGDDDYAVAKAYGMLPADVEGEATERTPAQNQTVRNVFVIGPDKKIKLLLVYPMTTGRNFDEVLRVIDSLQLTAKHRVATPAQWQDGDKVIITGAVSNDEAKEIFGEWESPLPYIRLVPQPAARQLRGRSPSVVPARRGRRVGRRRLGRARRRAAATPLSAGRRRAARRRSAPATAASGRATPRQRRGAREGAATPLSAGTRRAARRRAGRGGRGASARCCGRGR